MSDPVGQRRQRIDALDADLIRMFSERARLAAEIGELKGPGDGYRPGREAEVLRRAIADNPGPMSDEEVARIMREIMSACLKLETPLQVAYLGPAGTYTEAALYRFFGHGVTPVAAPSIGPIFRSVEAGDAHYGVVPIENSSEGVVAHTLDMLVGTSLRICGEITMPIHHHLLAAPGTDLEAIAVVRAHPQALAQCREWLDARLPHAKRVEASSNAEAARIANEQGGAAIASQVAADLYGLDTLASRIEDHPDNATRFLVIGDQQVPATGLDKTTVVVAARDRPGALLDLLRPFEEHKVNMTRIESRPSRRQPWDYHFFIDMEGHEDDAPVAALLADLRDAAAYLKVIGAYPAAVR